MKQIFRNTIVQQLLFWGIVFILLYRLFTRTGKYGMIDIYYTLLFMLPFVFIFYTNYFLVKRFLLHKRQLFIYTLGAILLLLLGIGCHYFAFNILSDYIFPGYYLVSVYEFWEVMEYVFFFLMITILLFLSNNWFHLKEKQLALERENHHVKLSSLKTQLNPHFLFNSLNNIYGISSPENKKAKNYLLKLSAALRYMVYETGEDLVPLGKEVAYLKDYFELEKLRLESTEKVDFQLIGDFSGYLIAPLILLPLVENCFKHFEKTKPFLQIHIAIQQGELILKTKNNKPFTAIKTGGFGLENLKNRLQLIYPNKHQFIINEESTFFETTLKLNLNQ
jgi:sensor histidine kinase YesM